MPNKTKQGKLSKDQQSTLDLLTTISREDPVKQRKKKSAVSNQLPEESVLDELLNPPNPDGEEGEDEVIIPTEVSGSY